MQTRWLFILFFVAFLTTLSAQNTDRKIRYRADMGYYDEGYLSGAQRLVGHVKFAQDNVVGYCDSAYLYEADNYIIAFGNPVKIVVGDSVFLYGKAADYDGIAKEASIVQNVKLVKGDAYLLTDSLFYDLNINCGYYNTGGKMFNNGDTLSSVKGRYYTNSDDAYLNGDVKLKSVDYKAFCDSLRYNAATKVAFFISPTRMIGKDNDIFTQSGYYNTATETATLQGNVTLNNKDQFLSGDSIYYDRSRKFGRAWKNVTYIDTTNKFIVKGNYMEHYEHGGTSIVTDSNLLIVIDDNRDSLFLHCDTLKVDFDTAGKMSLLRAYRNAMFFHKDLQGKSDSITYVVKDSILTMYYNPVIWADAYQLTADTIRYSVVDSTNSTIELANSGFIVGGLFNDTEFNQIKGINIKGFLVNRNLETVDIIGNAECVYYLQEEDSSLVGINTSITTMMHILLDSNKIHQIRYYDAPDGQVYPDSQLEEPKRRLLGFEWFGAIRPRSRDDVFALPKVRNKDSAEADQ